MIELSQFEQDEMTRWCRVFHAEAKAFMWRNLFCLAVVAWFCWAAWPWLMGFVEIARYWLRGHGYEVALIGSALMLLVFGIQGAVRNRRARIARIAEEL